MINPSTGSDDLGGTRASIGNVKLRLAPDDQPQEMGFSASRECTRATQDAYVAWNDLKSRTLSLSEGSPDPYLRRCTDSQTLSGKYATDDWVFNLIGAWQQQNYSRTFPSGSLIVNMPQRWNQMQGATRRHPRRYAYRGYGIWVVPAEHPRKAKFRLRYADDALFKQHRLYHR